MPDFILNGQGYGDIASVLMAHDFDPGALRPYVADDGYTYITTNNTGKPITKLVYNAVATLRKDAWKEIDRQVMLSARERLRAIADLRAAGLTVNLQNGMGTIIYEYERMSDATPAEIAMDPIHRSDADRLVSDMGGIPLPVIQKDFHYTARQIASSQRSGSPLDTTHAEAAARKVAEEYEKLLLGVHPSFSYGGYSIYGYTNFPQRLTKVLTAPDGTNQKTTLQEVIAMKAQSQAARHHGPWILYVSPDWDEYLDDDFSSAKGDNTLRERLRSVEGIVDIRTLDFLPEGNMILVELTSEVIRLVQGMDITTVRWESMGGMMVHFKVMMIGAPQLRSDFYSRTGIVHGAIP